MREWIADNQRVMHNTCDPLGVVPTQPVSDCALARMCVCGRPDLVAFVRYFIGVLKTHLKKGTPLNIFLRQSMLVLRLDSSGVSIWLHLSHLNLSNWQAGVIPFEAESQEERLLYAERHGLRPLMVAAVNGFRTMTWWQAFANLDLSQSCVLNFEQLSGRNNVPPFDFVPGHVLTLDVALAAPVEVWPPKVIAKEKVVKVPRPRGLLPHPLAEGDQPLPLLDAVEDPNSGTDEPLPECNVLVNAGAELGWCDDGSSSDGFVPGIDDGDPWAPPSPRCDPPIEDLGPVVPDVVAPPVVDVVVPVVVDPAPPPIHRAPGVRRGGWRRVVFPGVAGYIDFDPTSVLYPINAHCTFGAHCKSAECKMDRRGVKSDLAHRAGQGRPVAFLYAWLLKADEFRCDVSGKTYHQQCKKNLGRVFGYPERSVARAALIEMALTRPEIAELLRMERDQYAGEDSEPIEVP
jgi:hypothetical protein